MNQAQWLQVIAVGVPAMVSVVSAVIAARYAVRSRLTEQQATRLLALEERTAERKREVYEPFVATLGAMLVPSQQAAALVRMEEVMSDFQTFVTIWGSDEVIDRFYRFRRAAVSNTPPSITMRMVAELLIAIRRDVAWPDTKVTPLQTLGSRITDLEPGSDLEGAFTLPFDELVRRENWTPPW